MGPGVLGVQHEHRADLKSGTPRNSGVHYSYGVDYETLSKVRGPKDHKDIRI